MKIQKQRKARSINALSLCHESPLVTQLHLVSSDPLIVLEMFLQLHQS